MKEHSDAQGKEPIFLGINGRFARDSQPEAIVAKVRQWIDVLGRGGMLMLNIANIPADASSLNVLVASGAVHTLGRCPIAADLNKVEVPLPVFTPFDEWLKGQAEEEVIRKACEK